jgi:hypothetical protein
MDNGLGLSASDAAQYAQWLSGQVHALGMSAGLSTEELASELAPSFDWALAVGCLQTTGCAGFRALKSLGREVLLVEFGDVAELTGVCELASELGFNALVKHEDLGAFRLSCPGPQP